MRTLRGYRLMIVSLFALLLMSPRAIPQGFSTDTPQELRATSVIILTDVDSSVVFIDDERMGVTPLSLANLSPGIHHILLQHPDSENWLTNSISDSIRVVRGQPQTLRYRFEPRYVISSMPFDAEVVLADSVIGKTPFILSPGHFLLLDKETTISIRKPGFETETLDIAGAYRGVLSVTLREKWENRDDQDAISGSVHGQTSKPLHLTLAIAGTVLSGTAAAYFKIKADDRYLAYRTSGNPALLQQSRRLDAAAAISLIAAQVGLGFFTYFVLSN